MKWMSYEIDSHSSSEKTISSSLLSDVEILRFSLISVDVLMEERFTRIYDWTAVHGRHDSICRSSPQTQLPVSCLLVVSSVWICLLSLCALLCVYMCPDVVSDGSWFRSTSLRWEHSYLDAHMLILVCYLSLSSFQIYWALSSWADNKFVAPELVLGFRASLFICVDVLMERGVH